LFSAGTKAGAMNQQLKLFFTEISKNIFLSLATFCIPAFYEIDFYIFLHRSSSIA